MKQNSIQFQFFILIALACLALQLAVFHPNLFSQKILASKDIHSSKTNTNILWYNKPADQWNEALPIGNGRLGGMVFGKTDYERVQLNEKSMWSGSRTVTDKPDAYKYLPEVRRLLFEGK
jgi:hypothetical protein